MAQQPAVLSPQAGRLVTDFAQQPGVRPEHVQNLHAVITSSPSMINQLNAATAQGSLQRFEVLPPGTNAGGEYHPDLKAIKLPTSMLENDRRPEAAFILGHEAQHALNSTPVQQAAGRFLQNLDHTARSTQDYTGPIADLITTNRIDEASANLAGWNAMVDHLRSNNPQLTLDDVQRAEPFRSADFVAKPAGSRHCVPHANLTLNPDLSVSMSQANVEGMGRNYVDKSPEQSRLGPHGRSDYRNYYGAWAVSRAAAAHSHYHPQQPGRPQHPMTVDLNRLGLSRRLMEENGIDLATNGQQPLPYLDRSTNPPTRELFHHTAQTNQYVPITDRTRPNGTRVEPDQPRRTQPEPGRGDRSSDASRLAALSFSRPAGEATRGSDRPSTVDASPTHRRGSPARPVAAADRN